MRTITLAATLALTMTISTVAVQARDTPPVNAIARGGGPGLSAVVLNTVTKRSIDVAQVLGRGGPTANSRESTARRFYANRHVAAVMGRS